MKTSASKEAPFAKKIMPSIMLLLLLGSLAQNAPQQKAKPVQPPSTSDLVEDMAQLLSRDLS